MENYTRAELKLVSHSLGIDLYKMVMSHKKSDKELPEDFYRNHYQTNKNDLFENLIKKGLVVKRNVMGDNVYHITLKGVEKYREEVSQEMNYQPKGSRGLDYLKQRINWYCDWYGYKFGEDNADHIISAYVNYYLEGYRMSHTTTDCVKTFKKELKALEDIIVPKVKAESTYS